jgi:protein disulfide-isomerase
MSSFAILATAAHCLAAEPPDPAITPSTNRPAIRRGPFDETADAHKEIADALALAKADRKLILLDFGANWCPDCIALSRLLEDEGVRGFVATNFHLVKIDVGRRDRNQDLCARYDAPVSKGIPAVVVLDADGCVLAATRGGELADARRATAVEVLNHLKRWRALKP